MKTVGTKLDTSEYEIFEFCCNENGLSKSEQLRYLIRNFVCEKTDPPKNVEESTVEILSNEYQIPAPPCMYQKLMTYCFNQHYMFIY